MPPVNETATSRTIGFEDVPLLAAVVLLPLAFAGVEAWAFRSATFLIALSGALALARHGWAGWALGRSSLWLLPAFGLLAWALVQLVPLPAPLLERISPAAHGVYEEALMLDDGHGGGFTRFEEAALARIDRPPSPVTQATVELDPAVPICLDRARRPISLEPGATFERAVWFGSLLLAFLLVSARTSDPARARVYVAVVGGSLVLLATIGLLQAFTWNGNLLWFRRIPGDRLPFGPYVNRVHFGGMMELAVPMLVGVAMERWRRYGRDAVAEPGFVVAIVGAVTCAVAALGSTSKAAVVLVAGATALLGLLSTRSRRVRLGLLIAVPVVLLLFPLATANFGIGERLESFMDRAVGGHRPRGSRGRVV